MFCSKCGKETNNDTSLCSNCNTNLYNNYDTEFVDKGGFKYGFLGFLFPFSGIIIYYMLKDKEPNLSNSFKIGAIVGIVLTFLSILSYWSIYILGIIEYFNEFLYY